MFRRICLLCLLCWLSFCSLLYASPIDPTYKETTLKNPYNNGVLLQKAATGAIIVPNNYPIVMEFDIYYQNESFYFGNISLLQFNKKPPINIKQILLLSDFRTIEISPENHKKDVGLDFTTDSFMLPPSLGNSLKGFFRAPSDKIVLRLLDEKNNPHDYFLEMNFVALMKKSIL